MIETRTFGTYKKTLDYLNDRIGKGKLIFEEDIHNALGLEIRTINNACKANTNLTFSKLRNSMYVQKALYFYHEEKLIEKEIAEKLGFVFLSSFCNFFKRNTGVNLKDYEYKKDKPDTDLSI